MYVYVCVCVYFHVCVCMHVKCNFIAYCELCLGVCIKYNMHFLCVCVCVHFKMHLKIGLCVRMCV